MNNMNAFVSKNAVIGEGTRIGINCIIEDDVIIGKNVFVDHNVIIRSGAEIGDNSFIGANCILGEYQMDFIADRASHRHKLLIGSNSIIRSGSILYCGSTFGEGFQTGHQVTIREETEMGDHVSVGTLSDIQGHCRIGSYVRMHSNVHIGQASHVESYCWIFPYVVLTNDPTPPSDTLRGVHIHLFSIVATGAIILPGIEIHSDALIGAGAIVNKDVPEYAIILGNPGMIKGDVRNIINRDTGESHYPWRYHFNRAMPWEDMGFEKWYNGISDEQKRELFQQEPSSEEMS